MTITETRATTAPAEPAVIEPEVAGPPPAPPKRRLTRFSRIGLVVIAVLALLETTGLTVRYMQTDHLYVISDNAQVDGNLIEINAPISGTVTDWRLDTGSSVERNQIIGRIELPGGGSQPSKPIHAPQTGTVARTYVSEGVTVTAGSQLAAAYDEAGVYVTARVEETDVADVHVGAPVTIEVDDGSGRPVTGTVASVGAAAAGVSELDPTGDPLSRRQPVYPGPNTDSRNPKKVDQYVPVRIALTDTGSAWITPGMNVTVDIRRP